MKIDIDLSSVFVDEEGNEVTQSFRDAILSEVTERIASSVQRSVDKQLKEALDNAISKSIQTKVDAFMDAHLTGLLDYEYTPTSSWGSREEPLTVRNRILKAVENQAEFKERGYSSEENHFTKTIKKVVDEKISTFQKQYNKIIDDKFTADAMAYAEKKLRERLKI